MAGLAAADRFDATPAALSTFVVLQLVVYAALQVPVGLLLDRFGARTLIVIGGLTMVVGQVVGQVVLAVATALPAAVAARALVGAGDASTFISVLRVVNAWFPARRAPLMTQLTGLLGQLGQVLSAIPLVALLHGPGWGAACGSAAGLGVLAVVLVLAVVRDRPPGAPEPSVDGLSSRLRDSLRSAWLTPGTRLGFWSHMGTQFSGTVFVLLWGVPFLVVDQRMSPAGASALLTLFVLAGIAMGPVMGELTARHPLRRSWLVLTVIGTTALVWTVVLLTPPPVPRWLLVVLVLVLACGAPGSMVGFDYARTFNLGHRQGTAVGIVNVGGFSASVLVILVIGIVLDSVGGAAGYDEGRSGWRGACNPWCGWSPRSG